MGKCGGSVSHLIKPTPRKQLISNTLQANGGLSSKYINDGVATLGHVQYISHHHRQHNNYHDNVHGIPGHQQLTHAHEHAHMPNNGVSQMTGPVVMASTGTVRAVGTTMGKSTNSHHHRLHHVTHFQSTGDVSAMFGRA